MSWVATAVIATVSAGTAMIQANAEDNARKDAEKQAREDRAAALRKEQFAETEGEGLGMIGNVSLSVDDDLDTEMKLGKIK